MRVLTIAALVLLLSVPGCASESDEPTPTLGPNSRPACERFHTVMRDSTDGLLTQEEVREGIREVQQGAIIAHPEVEAAARDLLRAFTALDVDAGPPTTAMVEACRNHGF